MAAAEQIKEIDHLLLEANRVRNKDPKKGFALAKAALKIASANHLPDQEVRSYISIALTHQILSHFPEALAILGTALQISKTHKDELGESDVYSGYGNVYYYMGDNDHALKYHLEGLRLREKHKNIVKTAYSINSVGVIYATMKNFEQAEDYFCRSMKTNLKLKQHLGAKMAMNNLAVLYTSLKKFEKAIQLLNKALPGSDKLPNDTIRCELLINLGVAFHKNKNYKGAEKQFMMALAIINGRKNLAEAKAKEGLARLFSETGRHAEAKKLSKEVLTLYKKLGVKESISNAYRLLGDVEKNSGNTTKAISFLEKHLSANESLHEEELLKKAKNLSLAFQAEDLRKENEINHLRNVELKKAYDQINEKNNQLIDSIQYAQYFQEMIFEPYNELFSRTFPDSFLLIHPKDIVSGDFFWCSESTDGNKIVLVLADCTGHGVPGAFVSLVGNSLLNSAVHEKKISDPAGILDLLNKHFCAMDGKAGMDVCVLLIDTKKNTLEYAGVNAGLVMIRANEIIVNYKGGATLIGAAKDTSFKSEAITLQADDTICLFSDGFVTQKGGPSGKKLLRDPFTKILSDLSSGSLTTAASLLGEKFKAWQGDHEQQDDVTVAGFRI